MAQDSGMFLPGSFCCLGRQQLSWALAASALAPAPLHLPAFLADWALSLLSSAAVSPSCHFSSRSSIPSPMKQAKLLNPTDIKRPAPWQDPGLYTVQFYSLKHYPIITPLTGTDQGSPATGSDPVSPEHPSTNPGSTPFLQTRVLKLGWCSGGKEISWLCVVRGTKPPCRTLLHQSFLARGCGWRSECQTRGRSIIDLPRCILGLPFVEDYHYDFPVSLVCITKLFSPEKLPNRHIIHACSGLPVGLSRSVRASNTADPIGLGPRGDFRERFSSLGLRAARLPQYRPTQYQSQLIHC